MSARSPPRAPDEAGPQPPTEGVLQREQRDAPAAEGGQGPRQRAPAGARRTPRIGGLVRRRERRRARGSAASRRAPGREARSVGVVRMARVGARSAAPPPPPSRRGARPPRATPPSNPLGAARAARWACPFRRRRVPVTANLDGGERLLPRLRILERVARERAPRRRTIGHRQQPARATTRRASSAWRASSATARLAEAVGEPPPPRAPRPRRPGLLLAPPSPRRCGRRRRRRRPSPRPSRRARDRRDGELVAHRAARGSWTSAICVRIGRRRCAALLRARRERRDEAERRGHLPGPPRARCATCCERAGRGLVFFICSFSPLRALALAALSAPSGCASRRAPPRPARPSRSRRSCSAASAAGGALAAKLLCRIAPLWRRVLRRSARRRRGAALARGFRVVRGPSPPARILSPLRATSDRPSTSTSGGATRLHGDDNAATCRRGRDLRATIAGRRLGRRWTERSPSLIRP